MDQLSICPDKVPYFQKKSGRHFVLVISEALKEKVKLCDSGQYLTTTQLVCKDTESISDFSASQLPQDCDVLFMPFKYPKHPLPDTGKLNKTQKFYILSCHPTTPVTIENIQHCIESIYSSEPKQFIEIAENFYEKLEQSTAISYYNPIYNTSLQLDINENCLWSDILGQVYPGESGVIPAGEIALTHVLFKDPSIPTLPLNGEMILQGQPILHGHQYNDKNFLKEQNELYHQFRDLIKIPLKCIVESGTIKSIKSINNEKSKAKKALEQLFSQDDRYRHISEIGIGLDTNLRLTNNNFSANETYGGSGKCIHFAIGTPSVDYHLDIICPDTLIKNNKGNMLLSAQNIPLKRVKQVICPCENS